MRRWPATPRRSGRHRVATPGQIGRVVVPPPPRGVADPVPPRTPPAGKSSRRQGTCSGTSGRVSSGSWSLRARSGPSHPANRQGILCGINTQRQTWRQFGALAASLGFRLARLAETREKLPRRRRRFSTLDGFPFLSHVDVAPDATLPGLAGVGCHGRRVLSGGVSRVNLAFLS